ncbi:hypothetical protein OB13_10555 [Pontibacter sp. HJ8]
MAKINPRDITRDTECYAAVEWEIGFRCGRVKDGKLYSLENPDLYMIMPDNPKWILAAFETREELERWYEGYCGSPMPAPEPRRDFSPDLFDSTPDSDEEATPAKGSQVSLFDLPEAQDKRKLQQEQVANLKFKIKQAEELAPHLKAVNLKIRIDEGLVYFEANTKHTEPWPFTSLLFQQMIDHGAVLEQEDGYYALYADRSKREQLSSGSSFIALLGVLADRQYRLNMHQAHEASLDPSLTYISKGNPEKKQPPFILSKIL